MDKHKKWTVFIILTLGYFLIGLTANVQGVEYHLNQSEQVTFSESSTDNLATHTQSYDRNANGPTHIRGVWLDFNTYGVIDKMRCYLNVMRGSDDGSDYWLKHHDGSNNLQINDSSGSFCYDITVDTNPDINGTLCIYPQSTTAYYIFYFDFEDYSGLSGGATLYDINYTAPTYPFFDGSDFTAVQNGQWTGAIVPEDNTVHPFNEYDGCWIQYSSGNINDWYWYSYDYYSGNSSEKMYLNVSKLGDTSKWYELAWKSFNLGDDDIYYTIIESSLDTTGFNWSTNGYAINISVFFDVSNNETITFTSPTGGEAPTGTTCYEWYAWDIIEGVLLNDVTLNIWGGVNYTETFDKYTQYCIDNGTAFNWNLTKTNYSLVGGGYSETAGSDNDTELQGYLKPTDPTEYGVSDTTNNTVLIYYTVDSNTNLSISNALVTSDGVTQYTNEYGITYYEVVKNTSSIKYSASKTGYYSSGGYTSVNTEIKTETVDLLPITTATPTPTNVTTTDRETAQSTLNEARESAPELFMLVLLVFVVAVLKRGLGGK